jgi:F-type H+-transporting ATPase subunit epsilon
MIHFELVTLSGTKFSQEVYEVMLPTPQGYIAVLPEHMPLVSLASEGVISIRHKEGEYDELMERFAVSGGVIEISGNKVRVLVDEADHEDEISEAETQKAIERARKLREEARDQVDLDKAQSMIDRHTTRLKVAELKRHRRSRR